jgi:structural maintenance of chromosome 4
VINLLTCRSDLGEEQEDAGLPTHSRDELLGLDRASLKDEISQLEAKLQKVTDVDLGVLREYRRRVEEHATRSADLAESLASRDTAKKRCDELRKLRLEGFMEGFSIISMRLKEMYQMITMGGNAELELVDSLDPFSEGILFSVMPPKKSWKNISNLSGGEKTLSSLALVFALHHYKPTPLYVMDEIDAALDFRNVRNPGCCEQQLTAPGLNCSQLHQGTHQERPVHCDLASKQHGESRHSTPSKANGCSLNLPHG